MTNPLILNRWTCRKAEVPACRCMTCDPAFHAEVEADRRMDYRDDD